MSKSGFTIYRRFHRDPCDLPTLQKADGEQLSSSSTSKLLAGSTVRFFHKELEAYMTAEGPFNEEASKDGNQFL